MKNAASFGEAIISIGEWSIWLRLVQNFLELHRKLQVTSYD